MVNSVSNFFILDNNEILLTIKLLLYNLMNTDNNLTNVWDKYYEEYDDTAIKDKNFFELEINAIRNHLSKNITSLGKPVNILELGSGTGYLASILTSFLDLNKIDFSYVGVDFSKNGIEKADKRKLKNCTFVKDDFNNFLNNYKEEFDCVITQRSLMAIMDLDLQINLLNSIKNHMSKNSIGIFSEVSIQAFEKLQSLRKDLTMKPLEKVWHSKYLDENLFKNTFSNVKIYDFSSIYWLVTRVIYPYFEEPKHNTKLHDFTSKLEQTGNYGLVKVFVVKA